jgi:stage II sporulation protein M
MKNKKQKKRSLRKKEVNYSFLKLYKQCWRYLKECKNFIYFIIGIFFVFALIGYFIPMPEELKIKILDMLTDLFKKTENYGFFEMILFIFFNNLKSSFFGIIFGVLFGIFPIISSLLNGFLLGFVANLTIKEKGFFVLWQLFPHGIFELPAVFISLGMGLKFGTVFFEKNKKKNFFSFFINSIKVFILIVIPLLVIAAVIESILIIGLR